MDLEKDLPSVVAEVIDELHDAVFDATAWERFVTIIGNWVPDFRPLLHVETLDPARVVVAKYVGWDPQVISLYANHYVDKNVFRRVVTSMGINEVGISTAHVSEREVMQSAIYADILSKTGDIRVASGFAFARDPVRFAVLGFHYPHAREEDILPLGIKFQNMIAPTARRAFMLAVRAASLRKTQEVAAAIDNLAIPALVLDDDGCVIRANRLGCPLIRGNDVIRLSPNGKMQALLPHDTARLHAAFARAHAERHMVTCPYTSASGMRVVAHFVPMRRSEATDPLIESFVGSIDPAAIVYLRLDDQNA